MGSLFAALERRGAAGEAPACVEWSGGRFKLAGSAALCRCPPHRLVAAVMAQLDGGTLPPFERLPLHACMQPAGYKVAALLVHWLELLRRTI
jgi:hypothetical protein